MASGTDTQTDTQAHTCIPTREPKQFQETRRARPSAVRAWFKNIFTIEFFPNYSMYFNALETFNSMNVALAKFLPCMKSKLRCTGMNTLYPPL